MLGWILVFTLSISLLFCLCRSGLALILFGNSVLNMVPGRLRTTSRLTSEGPCTAGILLSLFTRVFVAQLLLARHCLLMQRVEMALAPSSWEDRHRIMHCALDAQGAMLVTLVGEGVGVFKNREMHMCRCSREQSQTGAR